MNKQYYVYIMANKYNTVLYTGVTNDLRRRVYEHKLGLGVSQGKYNITKLDSLVKSRKMPFFVIASAAKQSPRS